MGCRDRMVARGRPLCKVIECRDGNNRYRRLERYRFDAMYVRCLFVNPGTWSMDDVVELARLRRLSLQETLTRLGTALVSAAVALGIEM